MRFSTQQGTVLVMLMWWLNLLMALGLTATWRSVEARLRLAHYTAAQQALYAAEAGLLAGERLWPAQRSGHQQGLLEYRFHAAWTHSDTCQRHFYAIDSVGIAAGIRVRLRMIKVDKQHALQTPTCQLSPRWQHWERFI